MDKEIRNYLFYFNENKDVLAEMYASH